MARYLITLRSGDKIEADDVRILEGGFVQYITRHMHEIKTIPGDQVSSIDRRDIGQEGGKRFTGEHDSSFETSPGSV